MNFDTKQQVLLAIYIEYQKDLPNMKNINNTVLNMDIDVFNIALEKLQNEEYIRGFETFEADNDKFYCVRIDNLKMTKQGIDYVENTLSIKKELTAKDKLEYIIKKCGIFGLQALKIFAVETIKTLPNYFY